MDTSNLTDEQKKFLEECEEEFDERYSEKDVDFMKIKNGEASKPPVMDPWHNKPHRPYENQGRNRRNNWDRRNRDRHDRDRYERHQRYRQ